MRILFLLTQDLESPSGLGRYLPLAKGLADLGHEVFIFALHANFEELEKRHDQINGVEIHYVAQMHVRKIGSQKSYFSPAGLIWRAAQATWALSKAALHTQVDLIHICKPHPMNSIAGLLARLRHHVPLFLDCDDLEAESHFTGRWQKMGVSYFENHVPLWVDHLTTHNQYLENYLLHLGVPGEKITYLPNGVDFSRFSAPANETVQSIQHQYNLTGKPVVGFIGSLSLVSHPVDLLLQAFREVHNKIPDSCLLIVGGGEDLDSLQAMSRQLGLDEAVLFTGRVAPDEVNAYYQVVDVIVDPVKDNLAAKTRLPLKLFESWVSGVPFISGDVGDRRRILGNPPAGLLVQPGSATALSEAILHILQNPAEADRYARLGLERAPQYDWRRLAGSLEQEYLTVCQAHETA